MGEPRAFLPAPSWASAGTEGRAAVRGSRHGTVLGRACSASCPPGARGAAGHSVFLWVRMFSVEAQGRFPVWALGRHRNGTA